MKTSHCGDEVMKASIMIASAGSFGQEIRRNRKAARLSQTDLATAMGTTRRLVSALENGERGVSIEMALAAAAELGLDVRLEPRS
jgi:transcriptional regulator with XRE-family HTH domain